MTVTHEGGLVYLDGRGIAAIEADTLARQLTTAAAEARAYRMQREAREKHQREVARLEASGLTHLETRETYRRQWYIGRRDGLPVAINLSERPARWLSEVGAGPPVEWRRYSGRKWRPFAELTASDHVGEWRVVTP